MSFVTLHRIISSIMFSIAIALSLASIAIATTPSHVGSTCSTTGLLPVLPTGQFALTLADGQATKFVAVGRGTQVCYLPLFDYLKSKHPLIEELYVRV